MANNFWMKLYHEMLDDPKVGRLSDKAHRMMINCFLMANEKDEEGVLPSVGDMAWRVRWEEQDVLDALQELEKVEIVIVQDGDWMVRKLAARQARIEDAEKQKAYRDRKRHDAAAGYGFDEMDDTDVTDEVTGGNEDTDQGVMTGNEQVTDECYEVVTDGNTDKEIDTEQKQIQNRTDAEEDKESAAASVPSRRYPQNYPQDTEYPRELLEKLAELKGWKIETMHPKPWLVTLFGNMQDKGVIAADLQQAWEWYVGKQGYEPANIEVLKKPIWKVMKDRTSGSRTGSRSTEFDAFVQR